MHISRAAVTVHLNFRAGSTFPAGPSLHCTYSLWTGLAGATRLTRSDFMLHIVEFTKGQICVKNDYFWSQKSIVKCFKELK